MFSEVKLACTGHGLNTVKSGPVEEVWGFGGFFCFVLVEVLGQGSSLHYSSENAVSFKPEAIRELLLRQLLKDY